MATEIINDKLKTVKMKPVNWHVEFEPTVAAIQRLKMQASANAEEVNFKAKTDGNDLKFYFGDHSTHAGNFVFQPGVGGQLKREWSWPVKTVISILDLTGDKVMRISDDGIAEITVDSGLATYSFKLPAQSK
jgi:Cu2+-containing amine oxidase